MVRFGSRATMAVVNVFGLTRDQLIERIAARGAPAYRARQIYRWMYARRASSFDDMTDLPASLRGELGRAFEIALPDAQSRHTSQDGTVRHLLSLAHGKRVAP